mmetsp:Transcript_30624/g.59032  ORF Transcript_30624/g.59032 Transcript_30624/m.59032 type:complete len:311 (+) Transcript_30624:114-1046(+)
MGRKRFHQLYYSKPVGFPEMSISDLATPKLPASDSASSAREEGLGGAGAKERVQMDGGFGSSRFLPPASSPFTPRHSGPPDNLAVPFRQLAGQLHADLVTPDKWARLASQRAGDARGQVVVGKASHPAAELAARRPVRAASPPAGASHGGNMKRAGSRAHPGEYLGRLGGYPAYTSSAHAVGSLGSVLSGGAQMSPKQQLRLCSRLSVPKTQAHAVHCIDGRKGQGVTGRGNAVDANARQQFKHQGLPVQVDAIAHTRLGSSTVKLDHALRKPGGLLAGQDYVSSPLYESNLQSTFVTKSHNTARDRWLT